LVLVTTEYFVDSTIPDTAHFLVSVRLTLILEHYTGIDRRGVNIRLGERVEQSSNG
jgi:hypothetical protein